MEELRSLLELGRGFRIAGVELNIVAVEMKPVESGKLCIEAEFVFELEGRHRFEVVAQHKLAERKCKRYFVAGLSKRQLVGKQQ